MCFPRTRGPITSRRADSGTNSPLTICHLALRPTRSSRLTGHARPPLSANCSNGAFRFPSRTLDVACGSVPSRMPQLGRPSAALAVETESVVCAHKIAPERRGAKWKLGRSRGAASCGRLLGREICIWQPTPLGPWPPFPTPAQPVRGAKPPISGR